MQEFNTLYKNKKINKYLVIFVLAYIINIVNTTLLKKLNTEVFNKDLIYIYY